MTLVSVDKEILESLIFRISELEAAVYAEKSSFVSGYNKDDVKEKIVERLKCKSLQPSTLKQITIHCNSGLKKACNKSSKPYDDIIEEMISENIIKITREGARKRIELVRS